MLSTKEIKHATGKVVKYRSFTKKEWQVNDGLALGGEV